MFEANERTDQKETLFVLPFDADGTTVATVGGKGINLIRMTRAGFPVPPGFVVTTAAYDAFVRAYQLNDRIFALSRTVDANQPGSGEAVSSQIGHLFDRPLPGAVEAAIKQMYRERFGSHPPPVAVRSSGTAEDLPEASFAGQQETYLNVQGEEALLDAVRRCWASLWTARAMVYREKEHIRPESVSLAVLVQEMVAAEAAGVLITANPVTGRRNELVINASWGLGEAIVSGLVVPDTIVYDTTAERVLSVTVAEKQVMTVPTEHGTEERPVPEKQRHEPVLRDEQIKALAQLGQRIAHDYGQPMDIEWCAAHGAWYILQARAITALPPEPLAWKPPGPGQWVHGGGSIELFIEPVSPSCATYFVDRSLQAIYGFTRRFGLESMVPVPLASAVNGYLYLRLDWMNLRLLNPLRLWGIWQEAREQLHSMSKQEAEVTAYRQAVQERLPGDLTPLSFEQLFRQLDGLMNAGIRYWIHVTGLVQAIPRQENRFIRYYQTSVRREGDPEPQILLRGQSDLLPMQAERLVYALAELAQHLGLQQVFLNSDDPEPVLRQTEQGQQWLDSLADHLRRFGHQLLSFDLLLPTLVDDPKPILLSVKTYLEGKEAPEVVGERLAAQRDQAIRTIEARLSESRRETFRSLLAQATAAAGMREDALFEVGLAWPPMRQYLLEIGRRFAEASIIECADDIFWLAWEEIQRCAAAIETGEQPSSFVQAVAERKMLYQREQQTVPPYLLPVGSKPKFWWKWLFPTPELKKQPNANMVVGMGVSPGTVTGVARVITTPQQMSRLNKGEILVAHTTTPAWTPLFSRTAALVTDLGGPLAHGSIVAREYGIPAVMGTGVATQKIQDGQTITVDGTNGKVLLQ